MLFSLYQLHLISIKSLFDVSVGVSTGIPPSEYIRQGDPGGVQRGVEGGSTQRVIEIV